MIHLCVICTYIHPSVFRFRMITRVNINEFSPNLVCALILWRSGFGMLMGKFCQILTHFSAREMPIFSFPDNNFSKCLGITKLGTCIDLRTSGSGLLMGKFRQLLTVLSACDSIMAGYYCFTFCLFCFESDNYLYTHLCGGHFIPQVLVSFVHYVLRLWHVQDTVFSDLVILHSAVIK